jgi:hypothetical protein
LLSLQGGHAVAKYDPANMTALQKHVSFFDRNKNGIITPPETFEGDYVVSTRCFNHGYVHLLSIFETFYIDSN